MTGFEEGQSDIKTTSLHSTDRNSEGKSPSEAVSIRSKESYGSAIELTDLNHLDNPFLDKNVAEYYRKVYEDSKYECREVFDPEYTWTPQEERKLIWKLDRRVALTSCILFVALQVDRGNLSQAVSDNLLDDLNMSTNDFNLGNTLFLVAFLLSEIPMSLLSKKIGPDLFIPYQIIAFSLVATFQFFLSGKAGFIVCRILLGWLEGSLIADLVVWLSYFYKSLELPLRLAAFWTTLSLVDIGTSLLAFGLLRMRGVHGYAGWRWLFLIEGIFTFTIGLASFYLMVPSAVQTKNKFHPKGWFTDHEVKITVNRVLRDDPSKGDMNNRQAIDWKGFVRSISDYDLWPIYVLGLTAFSSMNTTKTYLTLTLKQIGFSTFNVNLLTIPAAVLHIILLIIITWTSEKINQRALIALVVPFWNIPILATMAFWSDIYKNVWGTWVLSTLIVGQPYIHAIAVSWASRNSGSLRTRSLSAAIYNIFVQLGSIYSNNIYRADDAPIYRRGNRTLFGLSVMLIPIFIATKFYYRWRNNQKAKAWDALSEEERARYLYENQHLGNKRLDFRFSE